MIATPATAVLLLLLLGIRAQSQECEIHIKALADKKRDLGLLQEQHVEEVRQLSESISEKDAEILLSQRNLQEAHKALDKADKKYQDFVKQNEEEMRKLSQGTSEKDAEVLLSQRNLQEARKALEKADKNYQDVVKQNEKFQSSLQEVENANSLKLKSLLGDLNDCSVAFDKANEDRELMRNQLESSSPTKGSIFSLDSVVSSFSNLWILLYGTGTFVYSVAGLYLPAAVPKHVEQFQSQVYKFFDPYLETLHPYYSSVTRFCSETIRNTGSVIHSTCQSPVAVELKNKAWSLYQLLVHVSNIFNDRVSDVVLEPLMESQPQLRELIPVSFIDRLLALGYVAVALTIAAKLLKSLLRVVRCVLGRVLCCGRQDKKCAYGTNGKKKRKPFQVAPQVAPQSTSNVTKGPQQFSDNTSPNSSPGKGATKLKAK